MAASPRERLITGAISLIRERGVAGAGITELLARSKTARRSIYVNFPGGKAQLVEESTRVAGQLMGAAIAHLTASTDPAQALATFIQMWKDILTAGDFTAGCPIAAAAMAGAEAPSAPAAAAVAFTGWQTRISTQLQRCGTDAETARSLATTAVAAVEGAVMLATASRSVQPLDDIGRHLTELVHIHTRDQDSQPGRDTAEPPAG